MSGRPPFRATLRPESPEAAGAEVLPLLLHLAGEQPEVFWEELARASRHPYEPLRLLALERLAPEMAHAGEEGEPDLLIQGMLEEALAEAEREGVLWTPILDRLAHWLKALEQQGATWAGKGMEALAERACRLAGWLSEQREPGTLGEVLAFRSPLLRAQVARHAGALSEEERVSLGSEVSPEMILNPHLPLEVREDLVRQGWEEWAGRIEYEARRHFADEWEQRWEWRLLVAAGSALPEGVPEEVREGILRLSIPRWNEQGRLQKGVVDRLLEALALDPHAPEETLCTLASHGGVRTLQALFRHPHIPAEVLEDVVAQREGWGWKEFDQALQEPGGRGEIPEANLSALLTRMEQMEPKVLALLISQPQATPEMWRRALETRRNRYPGPTVLLEKLAEHPRAALDPPTRRALLEMGPGHTPLLLGLFPIEEPEAYREVLLEIARRAPAEAYAVLREHEPPAGVRIPNELLGQLLLEAPGVEERLFVISQLERWQGREEEGPTPAPREREHPETAPGGRRR